MSTTPTTPTTAAPRRAPIGRFTRPQYWLPLLSLAAFLAVWEVVGRNLDPILFSPPSRVAQAGAELYQSGQLLTATGTTLATLTVGYALAILIGVPLGVAVAQAPMLGRLLDPYLYGIFATPRVVIVPLVIVWFGVGYPGRLFLVVLWSMIAIATTTADGVRNARPDLVEVARSYGASRADTVRHVLLPGAVPFVLSGLRVGAERAVVGVVIGEMFLELTGLGGLIQQGAADFDTAVVLCAVATVAVLGTALITGLDVLEGRFSRWKGGGGP